MDTRKVINDSSKAEKIQIEEIEVKWSSEASDIGICWEVEKEEEQKWEQ